MSPAGDIRRRPGPAEGSEAARGLRGESVDIEEGGADLQHEPHQEQHHRQPHPEPPPRPGPHEHGDGERNRHPADHDPASAPHPCPDRGFGQSGDLPQAHAAIPFILTLLCLFTLLLALRLDSPAFAVPPLWAFAGGYATIFAFGFAVERREGFGPRPRPPPMFLGLRFLPFLLLMACAIWDPPALAGMVAPLAAVIGAFGGLPDGILYADLHRRRLPPFAPGCLRAALRDMSLRERLMAASIPAMLALVLALAAAAPARSQEPPPGPVGPEVWREQALDPEEAARLGRRTLPFTREQIEILGRLFRTTRLATESARGEPPAGRVRRVRLADLDGAIPEVALRRGFTTALLFSDSTGAPWPIEEALVDEAFLPAGGDRAEASSHLLYLAPSAIFMTGNALVKLSRRPEPVALLLRGTGGDADFRVEVRLPEPGPRADPAALAAPPSFHAGDPALLSVLSGRIPPEAVRLGVAGGRPEDRAWRLGGDVLLVTRSHLLSPGPLAAEREPGGRWAYRLPQAPVLWVSTDGRETRLALGEPAVAEAAPQ